MTSHGIKISTLCYSCLILMAAGNSIPVRKVRTNFRENFDQRQTTEKDFPRARQKRVTYGTILRGIKAASRLLRGTKEVPGGGRVFRDFKKAGDYAKAKKDFEAAKPTNVRKFELPDGSEGMFGEAGDRNILLRSRGDKGNPEIEIMRYKENYGKQREFSGEIIKRILYTN